MIKVVNLAESFTRITDYWQPRVGGDINEAQIKLVKIKGEFVWHHHEHEDELFLVVRGELLMKLRDGNVTVRPGEFVIVPKGVEHCPVATEETHLILLEPRTTLNTGNIINDRTRARLEAI